MDNGVALAEQCTENCKKQVKTAGSTLDADETDLLVELFGAYTALLAFYCKTPERAETYFNFSMLPHNQSGAATGTSAGDTQP